MFLGGYQKISLQDFPGVIASIVFTRGCNFMCAYCHNSELINMNGSVILEKDFFDSLIQNRKMINGVVVSGGEPCIQLDLPDFLLKIKTYGFKVKVDTNGSAPDMIELILRERLVDYIAMDIKTSWENYEKIIHVENISNYVRRSFDLLIQSNIDYEFRTTIFPDKHKIEDFLNIASVLPIGSKYFIQDVRLTKSYFPFAINYLKAMDVANVLKKKYTNLIIQYR